MNAPIWPSVCLVSAVALCGCKQGLLCFRDIETGKPVANAQVRIQTGGADVPFRTTAKTNDKGIAEFWYPMNGLGSTGLFVQIRPADGQWSEWWQFASANPPQWTRCPEPWGAQLGRSLANLPIEAQLVSK
ncbi:MAG: hypothetical protein K2Q20_14340 [Phycisphaerales bacterium]|nr:hypothetical protein [Phycisphaerales bacterium]